jgi:RNA polymerase sigma-70 factor (ECF subfamily)
VKPPDSDFREAFDETFEEQYPRVFGFLDRLSGEPELAADISQEAFVKLLRRGAMPESPAAWLVTVGLNLYRNARAKRSRRKSLLSLSTAQGSFSDPEPAPDASAETGEAQERVRATLRRLEERDQKLLLLRAEGFSYREIANALALNEGSIGTLLARAKKAFRAAYQEAGDAP